MRALISGDDNGGNTGDTWDVDKAGHFYFRLCECEIFRYWASISRYSTTFPLILQT